MRMKRVSGELSGKELFMRQAAEMYERMTAQDQEQLVTFTQIEDRALELGRQLETLAIQHCIQRRARAVQTDSAPHCPKCREAVPRSKDLPVERRVLTRSGSVSLARAKCYCPSCRKTFFPSGPLPAARG
jgi:hypothetical protein